VGATGAAIDNTFAVPGLLVTPPLFRSTQVKAMVPGAPAVYVIVFRPPLVTPAVPPALVIVPPEMVQVYVMPPTAVTQAVRPVAPDVTGLAAVMAGVLGVGAGVGVGVCVGVGRGAVIVTLRVAAALCVPAALRSTQVRLMVPLAPEVNVRVFVVPLVSPAVPFGFVSVAFVIVHTYVMPARAVTEAVRPGVLGATGLVEVIVGFTGAAID